MSRIFEKIKYFLVLGMVSLPFLKILTNQAGAQFGIPRLPGGATQPSSQPGGIQQPSQPGGLTQPGGLPNPLGTTNIEDLLNRIVAYLYTISIPLVVIMVIIGAFQIMFAGGNPENVTKGKKTILYSVVGFVIVVVASGVAFILKELLGVQE